MLLALDLGTKMGWATLDDVCGVLVVNSGVENFKPTRFASTGMRYAMFGKWLRSLGGVNHVVFEEVRRHAGVDAAHAYGGFMAILQTFCEENGVDYNAVPVGTIKKFWTGKGNAKKEKMIAEANSRGFDVADDNEADALALLHYWQENGTFTL
jgi:Holliday junction resolvasome RuvABC endonuclease subunit